MKIKGVSRNVVVGVIMVGGALSLFFNKKRKERV